jgi:phosphopantetheinyl transferase (holo-ACP synthase)
LPGVGNDVVDLKEPGNRGKSGDVRFLGRVFTADERALIAGAACPDALLWSLWAVKEAAYKAVCRGDPAVRSTPRRYRVVVGGECACKMMDAATGSGGISGRVVTPRGELAFQVTATDDYVHALAAAEERDLKEAFHRVDRMDDASLSGGDASAFVRGQLLGEIARRTGSSLCDLEIRKDPAGPGVPRVFLRGRPLAMEISLSHDGRFTAFAVEFAGFRQPASE